MALLVDASDEQVLAGIIDRLRVIRIKSDISQNALAEVLPVRGRAISEWENQIITPTYDNLLLLMGALGQRLVIERRGVVVRTVGRRDGESWVHYERRRLVWPLKTRRLVLGMSQTELGDRVGVSRDSIQRWELVRVPPRPIAKIVWVHALGCSLELREVGPPHARVRRGHLYEGSRITDVRHRAELI